MYCPKCGYEYREGFYECSDCGSTLVPDLPATLNKKEHREPSIEKTEFIVVMRTGRIWEVEMVENAFKKAKIPHFQQSESSSGLVLAKQLAPSMGPGEWWSFSVPKTFLEKAKEVLASLPIDVTINPDIWHFNPPEEGKWFFKKYALFCLIAFFIILVLTIINFFR